MFDNLKKFGAKALLTLSMLAALNSYSQDININGTVKGAQYNNQLENVKNLVIKTNDQTRIDSTYTNTQGYYNLDFAWTGNQELNTLENKLYPNPYNEQTNIELNTPENGIYQLLITNLNGQTQLQTDIELSQGQNKITLNGGNTGAKIITLTNQNTKKTYKATQITNNNTPITYETTNINNSNNNTNTTLKSGNGDGLRIGDLVTLEYSKDGYETKDTTFTIALNQTINMTLEQTPYTFTTTLKPFLEDGTQITNLNPNFTITIEWNNGTTNTYPITNGEIQITKQLYKNLDGSLETALINNDTTGANGVQNWSIGRQPQQKTNRPNIYQNTSSNHLSNVAYQTEIPLDSLDQKIIYHYTIRKKAETQPGTTESLSSAFSRGLIESSGNAESGMFIDLKNYTTADSLDIVKLNFNITTGVPNTPEMQTRIDNSLQHTLNLKYLPNGDTLLPPHRVYTISSFSDPRWQAIIARNFENMIYTTVDQGQPGNTREWASTYTYNGELRLKNSSAMYSNNETTGVMFAENFSAVTGETEGVGGLTTYIWNVTTSQPSQYAKSISTIPVLLNLGTGQ
ncbi:MAG: hypothetical protein WC758_03160 [Candidatus Woesearchaeota archaeon]|jgi:hypothetical protein